MHGRWEPTEIRERTEDGEYVLVETRGYVPGALPPPIPAAEFKARHFERLMDTTAALSHLAGQCRNLDNPALLTSAFASREAESSSAIENTIANQTELALFEESARATDQVREVHNYIRSLQFAFRSDLPFSVRLMKECHEILLRGSVRGRDKRPGEFRTTQNYVGIEGPGLKQRAAYVPPPPQFLDSCISDLEAFANAETDIPELVRIAMLHYQFEAIHPFYDGNGRVGRMLVAHQLVRDTMLSRPLVYVSRFFEQYRDTYIDLLDKVTKEGSWHAWVTFFLRAVETQAQDASKRAERLLALRDGYRERLTAGRASAKLLSVVDHLFFRPALSAKRTAEVAGVSDAQARKYLERLTGEGIVEPTPDVYDRRWIAVGVIQAIEEDYE